MSWLRVGVLVGDIACVLTFHSCVWIFMLYENIACGLNFYSCVWIFMLYENIRQAREPG